MAVAIVKCSCKSEYQDKVYGQDMRLCNLKKKEGACCCTICGKEHQYKTQDLKR